MKIKIDDWFDIHHGYTLNLEPGYTALVGPNGAGKSTLIHQLEEYAKANHIEVFNYNNMVDGKHAAEAYAFRNEFEKVAVVSFSSEGEALAFNFAERVSKIGSMVRKAITENTQLFVLLDAIDSGASIDRIRELRSLFDLITNDAYGSQVYLVVAGNSYEMAKNAKCLDVRTGKYVSFKSYDEYADFICGYMESHKVIKKRIRRGSKSE